MLVRLDDPTGVTFANELDIVAMADVFVALNVTCGVHVPAVLVRRMPLTRKLTRLVAAVSDVNNTLEMLVEFDDAHVVLDDDPSSADSNHPVTSVGVPV